MSSPKTKSPLSSRMRALPPSYDRNQSQARAEGRSRDNGPRADSLDALFYAGPAPRTPERNPHSASHRSPSSTGSIDKSEIVKSSASTLKPIFHGMQIPTLLACFVQVVVASVFVTAWIISANKISDMSKDGGKVPGGKGATIFLHIAFAFAISGQLFFIERRVYRLRAERYAHKHAGAILPQFTKSQGGGAESIAYAPWNRAPLVTYAAALAQSGHATGSVDDHLIAIPPPPAYGNTRDSTLLLSGFSTEASRVQRPPSVHTHRERGLERGDDGNIGSSRESHLQESLARLERSRTGSR